MFQAKFLRGVEWREVRGGVEAEALVVVANDLGDELLYGSVPVRGVVRMHTASPTLSPSLGVGALPPAAYARGVEVAASEPGLCVWRPGSRALKVGVKAGKAAMAAARVRLGGAVVMTLTVEAEQGVHHDDLGYDPDDTEVDTLAGSHASIVAAFRLVVPVPSASTTVPSPEGIAVLPAVSVPVPPSTCRTPAYGVRYLAGVALVEECSHGIARHLWDAGVVMADMASEIGAGANVVELGTGIGVVSLALAKLLGCTCLLTDLEDARELCELNISVNAAASCAFATVDWESIDTAAPAGSTVVVADCTYNPTYYPALLAAILHYGGTLVLGHKFRDRHHDMEWFGMLSKACVLEKEVWVRRGINVIHIGWWRRR